MKRHDPASKPSPDTTGWPLVLDVDGTLCFDGRTISTEIADALIACRQDRELVFASARPIRDLLPVIPPLLSDATMIGGNGALIRRRGGEIRVAGFTNEVRRQLDRLIDDLGVTYFIDGTWNYSSTGRAALPIYRQIDPAGLARPVARAQLDAYVKLILFTTSREHVAAVRALPVTAHVHEAEGHIDISPTGIDKGAAVIAAGIPHGAFVAFGNDVNDATMFERSGFAICVGDHPVGRSADRVIQRADVGAVLRELAPSEGLLPS